jgi:hypothetical protein
VHAGLEDVVEVALGHVRAGVADLVRGPPVLERETHLARRARVHTDDAERPHERQHVRVALRLDRDPEPERRTGALERAQE